MTIARAREQLVAGDAAFYATVRDAWRACRCTEYAELLENLARTHGRRPIDEPKPKAWHAAWIARVREEDPLDLPGLLAGLVVRGGSRHASMVASCLDELARYPDDPQLVMPLIAILALDPVSSAWNKVQTRVFQLLDAANDPRAIAALEPALARVASAPATWSDSMRDSLARAAKLRDKLRARHPAGVPAAPAGSAGEISAIVATAPSKPIVATVKVDELDTLYAAVLEDPDDDARRAVYADALQLRGDPRGEIIALQLADTVESRKRAKTLIAKHRKVLLGGIAKTVIGDSAVFEKGFLVACKTDVRRATEAEVVFGRDEWATVKRLWFGVHGVLSPVMRSLEEAYGVPEGALAPLREHVLPRLRVLDLHPSASRGAVASMSRGKPSGMLAILVDTKGLPALRELHIDHLGSYEYDRGQRARGAEDFAWLLDAPCSANLERLVVPWDFQDPGALRSWIAVLSTRRALVSVEVPSRDSRILIEKRDGRLVATHDNVASSMPAVRDALGDIPLTTTPLPGPS